MTEQQIDVENVRKVLKVLGSAGKAEGDDGQLLEFSAYAVGCATIELLQQASRAVCAETMIEIGMASGLSTLAICTGRLEAGPMTPGAFHVIDPCQDDFRSIGLLNIRRAGLESLLSFHPLPSHAALPRLLEEGVRAQFAFVDGMHFLDYVMLDLFYLDQILDVGGVIALHDMWMPGIQHCVCYWLANRDYEPVALHDGRLQTKPYGHENRGCGDPSLRTPFFRRQVEPFVDWHTLFMKKTAHESRQWDSFRDFVHVPQTAH